jgi:hypothetical protein
MRRLRYNPTARVGMIHKHGSTRAALRLVVSGDIQSGFKRLIALGRPDLTVERSILDPRFDALFAGHPQERDPARWRLAQAGGRPVRPRTPASTPRGRRIPLPNPAGALTRLGRSRELGMDRSATAAPA